jgi:acetaldehyde dehydrogenase / alcohol dehydrogenase
VSRANQGIAVSIETVAPEARAILERIATPVEYAAGARLFKEGEDGGSCFLVDDGRVRIELERSEIDSESVLAVLDPGSIVGELSLIDGLPRSASAYAETELRTRRVGIADLETLRRSRPDDYIMLVNALAKGASVKLRGTNERLAEALFTERDPEIEEIVDKAEAAQRLIREWPEERIDALLRAMAEAVAARARELAESTVRVTHLGDVDSKTMKNLIASIGVYHSLVGRPGYGIIGTDGATRVTRFAVPVGIVFGLVPVTNPVSTAIFKALITVKSRNAIILSFHSMAQRLAGEIGGIIHAALAAAGAPTDLVQWVKNRTSRRKSYLLMRHPKVALILATGGASMVKAAYSSGKPAIGVGSGNTPTLIAADADPDHAARCIVASKSFDNGLICGSEHNTIVHQRARDALIAAFEREHAAVLSEDEAARFVAAVVDKGANRFRADAIGRSAAALAERAGIRRDEPIKIIVVPTDSVSAENFLAREKLVPVTSLFTVADDQAGIRLAGDLLEIEGRGHTAVIHTRDPKLAERYAAALPASRILVNSPAVQGISGMTTGLLPSMTLGCGTFGGTSTTDNVSYMHLVNVKRMAYYVEPSPDHPVFGRVG